MDDDEFDQLLNQARDGETAAVLAAVDLDPALATRGNNGGSRLLHLACDGGHLELVMGLLNRGSDVYARDISGWDALFCASPRVKDPSQSPLSFSTAAPTRAPEVTSGLPSEQQLPRAFTPSSCCCCPEGRTWRRR
jgi:hypothetical protein